MYGVVRERARNRPLQIAGLAISVLATVAAANLMMSGFGNFVGAFTPESTTLATITPDEKTEPPPAKFDNPVIDLPYKSTTPLPLPADPFVFELPENTITVEGGEVSRVGDPAAAVAAPKMVRIAPKLRTEEKPPYPAPDIRERNEGLTTISLCIDARGRVSSVNLAKSSGHRRLDDAALKWVKDARFSPGTVDGAPQAVCGHTVVYEWRLEDAR